jgi:hypothetical protein
MTNQDYLDSLDSMFGGPDETVIECRTTKIVTVRKEHLCMCPAHSPLHSIKPGERAGMERAIADGSWGTCYVCLPCLESWARHCDKHEDYCNAKLVY